MSAYIKYANNLNLKNEILDSSDGCVIVKITGNRVWQYFKNENGKHVVQRYPDNDSGGRRHTSVVTVAVLPIPPENKRIAIPAKDLDIKMQTGKQKAGGQNVNRIKSCVRMCHIPTGISVIINGRDQYKNKQEALTIITAKVNQLENDKIQSQYTNNKYQQMKGNVDRIGGRGEKRRTYNFIRGEIHDHILDKKTNNIKEFMKGNFSVLFN